MKKKYLIAIRINSLNKLFSFPSETARDEFIKVAKLRANKLQFATSEIWETPKKAKKKKNAS